MNALVGKKVTFNGKEQTVTSAEFARFKRAGSHLILSLDGKTLSAQESTYVRLLIEGHPSAETFNPKNFRNW